LFEVRSVPFVLYAFGGIRCRSHLIDVSKIVLAEFLFVHSTTSV